MHGRRFTEILRVISIFVLSNVLFLSLLTFFLEDIDFPNGSKTVYTTRTGECYHLSGCSSLRYSKYKTTIHEAVQDGYRSCSNCDPPALKGEDGTLFSALHYLCIVPLAALFAYAGSNEVLWFDSKLHFLMYLGHLALSVLLSLGFDLLF